ncbi:hypothetical protein SAMN05216532_0376 [Streptomyces sp. 2231.1]|uniref:hypothetical protein n=1 Tax=Streptomyces sp. 2231.1 TaxID=1855347 RepID=UPI00089B59F6|nr:hypothetical protein [Streptomyces sp. 2231.1]SEC07021.1 hypothetical protein SAMN05216532_0376 [Streptomyces sp. 2231.1]
MTRTRTADQEPLIVDGSGMLCATLSLHLRTWLPGTPAGTVVHVVATAPAARSTFQVRTWGFP